MAEEATVDNSAPHNFGNVPRQSSTTETQSKVVRCPWTHSKLQGDDDEHSGFGFPTVTYNEPVELNPEQLEKAKKAARLHNFRLKEVKR